MEFLYFWLGLNIDVDAFKGIHKEGKVLLLTIILQLIFVPIIGIWFAYTVNNGPEREVLILLALAPGGITSAIAARFLGLDLTLSVMLTSVTTLLNLLLVQPFVVPNMLASSSAASIDLSSFFLSLGVMSIGILGKKKLPKLAKITDKMIGVGIFIGICYKIYSDFILTPFIEWSVIILLFKFHFTLVVFSAIIASCFFGIRRAPLVVLESGFQNVTLVAAMAIPLGLPASIPLIYGGIMLITVVIIWLNIHWLNKIKPKLIPSRFILPPFRAQAIPPFGIFIRRDVKRNFIVIRHELVHWNQFRRLGFIGFYCRYFFELIRYGYDKSPMEMEARVLSKEKEENIVSYSERVHGQKPLCKWHRFLLTSIILFILLGAGALIFL